MDFEWAAGAVIYPDGGNDDEAEAPPSHEEIDALARRIMQEQARMERVLDETPEFEDRKEGVVSTDELINEIRGR